MMACGTGTRSLQPLDLAPPQLSLTIITNTILISNTID